MKVQLWKLDSAHIKKEKMACEAVVSTGKGLWCNNAQADSGSIPCTVSQQPPGQSSLKSQTQQRQTPPPNPFILLSPRLRQHHHRYFIHPTFLSAVTYRTSSILAMICSAQLLSFSTALRSRRRSASSRVSSPSARVSPMLLFCLQKGTEHPAWSWTLPWDTQGVPHNTEGL